MIPDEAQKVLDFWFGINSDNLMANSALWWKKDEKLDSEIKNSFEDLLTKATAGELEEWKSSPQGYLAFIILLDQFSRNMYRDTPSAFAQDELARQTLKEILAQNWDKELHPVERWFLYMPMMHSEEIKDHDLSLELFSHLRDEAEGDFKKTFESAYDFALKHFEIVKKYNRYPHRNKILGRENTPEEAEFLTQPGSSF